MGQSTIYYFESLQPSGYKHFALMPSKKIVVSPIYFSAPDIAQPLALNLARKMTNTFLRIKLRMLRRKWFVSNLYFPRITLFFQRSFLWFYILTNVCMYRYAFIYIKIYMCMYRYICVYIYKSVCVNNSVTIV